MNSDKVSLKQIQGKTIKLGKYEKVIAVEPEYQRGPGWSNACAWVYIVNTRTGKYRVESIQPDERSYALHYLFNAGEAMYRALLDSVKTIHAAEDE